MAIPKDVRITLDPEEIPKRWYNLAADLPEIKPPLNPVTKEPAKPQDFEAIFCKPIIQQEASTERYIDIPEEVRDNLVALNRPSPLQRAYRLERYLKTPAKIYFKREDMSPLGSHKGNTALAQAYYNAESGIHTLTTETGAGQWGTALAMVSNLFDIDTTVFMVKGSYNQKPFRKTLMHMYGAEVYASPSEYTEFGKKILKEHPDTTGSLGIAISEACELAMKDEGTCYALGSVLNHVMLHQTVIGEEAMLQMQKAEITPDYMIACVGGGSNAAGMFSAFLNDPDVFFLRNYNLKFSEEQKLLLAKINHLFGSVLFVSDDVGRYGEKELDLVCKTFKKSNAIILSVDLEDNDYFVIRYLEDGEKKELVFNLKTGTK